MTDIPAVTNELDRLTERIEKAAAVLQSQRTERVRLQADRDQLAGRVRELEHRLQGHDPAALAGELQALRREQREWQAERREVAARIEALVKKLERIEG
jgi:chromosome segregation ATPase